MKSIKKFEEYSIDFDYDIDYEYSKAIISRYIDNIKNGGTLQDSFDHYSEEIDEELREIVKANIMGVSKDIYNFSKKIKVSNNYFIRKDTNKYNI
jgi:hypothetical protein